MKKLLYMLIFILFLNPIATCEEVDYADYSQNAILFYSKNDIKSSQNFILKIPEDKRTPMDWLLLGNILQDKDQTQEAITMYERAVLLDETFYKPQYNIANIYFEEERYNMAIERYKKVIKVKPDFPYAYYNIGCAYINLGNFKMAKKYLSKAVELKNTEPSFQYNLAFTYKNLKKDKLAQRHLDFYNSLTDNK